MKIIITCNVCKISELINQRIFHEKRNFCYEIREWNVIETSQFLVFLLSNILFLKENKEPSNMLKLQFDNAAFLFGNHGEIKFSKGGGARSPVT